MELLPVRLNPGEDLRRALEDIVRAQVKPCGAFVITGIGSLVDGKLRFADEANETLVCGPLEIVNIAGSITPDGAHLHMTVSNKDGQVTGGHVGYGNLVRTTVEALLVLLPAWALTREFDPATGFKELVIRVSDAG